MAILFNSLRFSSNSYYVLTFFKQSPAPAPALVVDGPALCGEEPVVIMELPLAGHDWERSVVVRCRDAQASPCTI